MEPTKFEALTSWVFLIIAAAVLVAVPFGAAYWLGAGWGILITLAFTVVVGMLSSRSEALAFDAVVIGLGLIILGLVAGLAVRWTPIIWGWLT